MPRKDPTDLRNLERECLSILDVLQIEITKTADGLQEYVQLRSPAATPVNIVLIANRIEVSDHRRK